MPLECNSSSMPIQHRSGISKALHLPWNPHQYLLTILSLSLLECSSSSTLSPSSDILSSPSSILFVSFHRAFYLTYHGFHSQRLQLLFLHISLLIALPHLASSTSFHPAVCVAHHELISPLNIIVITSWFSMSPPNSLPLDAITEGLVTFGGVMLHFMFPMYQILCIWSIHLLSILLLFFGQIYFFS